MKIGYARVSTLEQNTSIQVLALINAGCKKIGAYILNYRSSESQKYLAKDT
jgi:DNA invertase Pin-like site-specific DNA recombinase